MSNHLIVNEYGNVDVRDPLPRGIVHVPGKRLIVLCRSLGMEAAKALVDIESSGGYGGKPVFDGVVVCARDAQKLREAIAERERRLAPRDVDVLAALFTLNRRAKRCRNLAATHYGRGQHGLARAAKEEKEEIYRLKGQVLHYLIAEGRLSVTGLHRFDDNWTELLTGQGYTFHRPCPPPAMPPDDITSLEGIEAKPKGTKEARLADAHRAVKHYLENRPSAKVYDWPTPSRFQRHVRDLDDDGDHECDDLDAAWE